MVTRLVHLSDLHCPAANAVQAAALTDAIRMSRPTVVVITGDLTRSGRSREFRSAAAFVEALPGQKIILPGNHDVPVLNLFARIRAPFRRFFDHFPLTGITQLETPDVFLVGFNTAVGMTTSLDWSLGSASPRRVEAAMQTLKSGDPSKLRLVAAHHPLERDRADWQRSKTSRGPQAFVALAQAGMDLFLHGHLHRSYATAQSVAGRKVWTVGATTALSERERGSGSGFNILDIDGRSAKLSAMTWTAGHYALGTESDLDFSAR